ncbi:hypothetical protein MTO96_018688 [Rhipicephalus appendiculatus]
MQLAQTMIIFFTVFSSSLTENIKVVPFYIPDKVMIGDTVKIVCYTNTVQAPLSFKWTKDGEALNGDEYVPDQDSR